MRKNKIEGVKPFNDFFFKSCYDHQLLAGIACFGIDRDALLLNTFTNIQEGFEVGEVELLNEKKLEKLLGYKKTHCNVSKRKLIKCIDKGQPIIMGVDAYYMEMRTDVYQIEHAAHFTLVYGYDLDNAGVNVVDHRYLNSFDYKEEIVSLDNLLLSNKMFRKGTLNRRLSCYILKRKRNVRVVNPWLYIDEKQISNNQVNSLKNLKVLFGIAIGDLATAQNNATKIINYLKTLKSFYYILSKAELFVGSSERQEDVMALVGAYSNILSLFWKVEAQKNYTYITKHSHEILRKLETIEKLEERVYEFLLKERQAL